MTSMVTIEINRQVAEDAVLISPLAQGVEGGRRYRARAVVDDALLVVLGEESKLCPECRGQPAGLRGGRCWDCRGRSMLEAHDG